MTRVFKFAMPFLQGSLVKQILVGLVLGIILGMAAPEAAKGAGFPRHDLRHGPEGRGAHPRLRARHELDCEPAFG